MMAVVPPKQTSPAEPQPAEPQAAGSQPAGSPAADGPPSPDRGPVLPQRSSDETDAGWGERPEPDDDERLRQERPPHYDQ
jgi:hypothetical protein